MTAYSGQFVDGVVFNESEAVSVYSAVTGYDPSQTQPDGSNPTDQGAMLSDVCKYMVTTGATDSNGHLHKLAAWAEISDCTNLRLLKKVANAFGAVYLAIQCPESALQQFNANQAWSYVPGSQIAGGHAIDLQWSAVGDRVWADEAIVTWGQLHRMKEAFARNYIVEAVAIVSADDVNVQTGRNPVGLDLQTMIDDCQTRFLV
jgi:hypothetical protein